MCSVGWELVDLLALRKNDIVLLLDNFPWFHAVFLDMEYMMATFKIWNIGAIVHIKLVPCTQTPMLLIFFFFK